MDVKCLFSSSFNNHINKLVSFHNTIFNISTINNKPYLQIRENMHLKYNVELIDNLLPSHANIMQIRQSEREREYRR